MCIIQPTHRKNGAVMRFAGSYLGNDLEPMFGKNIMRTKTSALRDVLIIK